jgi:hypothetical protein
MQQHFKAHQANVHAVYRAEGLAERLCQPALSKSVAALHVYHPEQELVNAVRRRSVRDTFGYHSSSFVLVVDSGTPKNLFPAHMLSNLERLDKWICGVGSSPLRSPCKGTVRLLISEPPWARPGFNDARHATIEVDAWGLKECDVGPCFMPLISLASLVRAGVSFSHLPAEGPLLTFPGGKMLSLTLDYKLRACQLASEQHAPAPGSHYLPRH